jgi:hypothetical protein
MNSFLRPFLNINILVWSASSKPLEETAWQAQAGALWQPGCQFMAYFPKPKPPCL